MWNVVRRWFRREDPELGRHRKRDPRPPLHGAGGPATAERWLRNDDYEWKKEQDDDRDD